MGHLQISSCSSSKDFGFSGSKFLSNNNDLNLLLRVFFSGCGVFSRFCEICLELIFFEKDFSYCKLHVLYAFQPKNKKENLVAKDDGTPKFIERKIKSA